ncbi:hypothetical protein SCP_0501370 [Sparassis crispa]|uniref:TECPR1-like DysF domain-containing protein n=1 Tax=Sparassis crispa TaxID=139825 RepID=A0A401GLM0_9APHY|nr:hypothetical protein SCP_0501370 [Sparassis crispa]GBE83091.1 hypothetical protein SCP_0501370 [Sparassis crispa]
MATLEYVEIPSYATRLHSNVPNHDIRPATKIVTSLPHPERATVSLSSPPTSQPGSPSVFNMPQMLLSSALQLPANVPATPRNTGNASRLITTRDPLSIPITTVNFKRFVAKAGPVFWLQDRFEEILMWKKGWKYTLVWMAAYAFLCCFPRMILLLPHVALLSVLLATHPSLRNPSTCDDLDDDVANGIASSMPPQSGEGSVAWLANMQAIQNFMGAYSDVYDFLLPAVPHLTHGTPYTPILLSLTVISILLVLPLVAFLPLRPTCLTLGIAPFLVTHPLTRTLLPGFRGALVRLDARAVRAADDDRLQDRHWRAEMREVELWENERWRPASSSSTGAGAAEDGGAGANAGWGKANLRPAERRAWTRGRDGWSGVADDGSGDVSSNLTFSLSDGWFFVETEDWRPDVEGSWIETGSDGNGWVYTNDSWQDPHPTPVEEWRAQRLTRRRRWTRRIYYDPASAV